METAIVSSNHYVSPVTTVQDAISMHQQMKKYIESALHKDVDYGVIPGAGDKPTLLKPGAEKLTKFFGISVKLPKDLREAELDWTGENHNGEPFFYFSYTAQAWYGDVLVAECEGSANSWEKKYRYRQADATCPNCGKATIRKSKKQGEGFYCWSKLGGCGAQFKANDERITRQETGTIKNPDPAEVVNTLQKMAQKRAIVGVTLLACNASEYFTQDIEDYVQPGEWNEVEETCSRQPQPVAQTKPTPVTVNLDIDPNDPPMDYETACKVTNSKGEKYPDLETKTLSAMANTISKTLKDNGITIEERDNLNYKLDAIKVILAHRQSESTATPLSVG